MGGRREQNTVGRNSNLEERRMIGKGGDTGGAAGHSWSVEIVVIRRERGMIDGLS